MTCPHCHHLLLSSRCDVCNSTFPARTHQRRNVGELERPTARVRVNQQRNDEMAGREPNASLAGVRGINCCHF